MSDYKIDWSNTNIDGSNTATSGSGSVGFTVSTPENVDHDQWMKGTVDGFEGLKAWDVNDPTTVSVDFHEAVQNVSFDLIDVDSDDDFDDRIKIIAKDAHGNLVPVTFSGTSSQQSVNGSQLDAFGHKIGAGDDGHVVSVHIEGPVSSIEVIYDNGAGANISGMVGLGDISFDAVAELDGYVEGTSGNDTIDVAYTGDPDGDQIDNNDALLPGEAAQDDVVLAGGGDDLVMAQDGDDEVYGEEGDDTLCGQDGDDVLYGGSGNDLLEGMNNDDVLLGQSGADTLYGDAGNDVMSGGTGNDKINGGAGDDVASGGKGSDTINMGNGNDLAFGGIGGDSIIGGAGNDTLIGGSMSYDGTQDFNDLAAGELVDGQYIADGVSITSGDPRNPVMAFDTANPTGGDNDLATSNLGTVLILSEDRDGSDPDDNASGGTFNIDFENPAEVTSLTLLDVEEGATVKYYDMDGNLLEEVDVDTANNGQFVVETNLQNVVLITVELTGSGAIDNLTYSINPDNMDGNDVISGGAGDDYIEGNAGNDSIDGGNDNDELYGGAGDDRIFGNDGDDTQFGGDGNDNLGGADSGNDTYYGGAGNDMVEASTGDDLLFGGDGNDDLWASSGNDVVYGGAGDDNAYGGHGQDEVYGDDGNDTLSGGSDSDTVYGGAGDDVIDGDLLYKDDTGAPGADLLFGGADADIIKANAGDTVDGGSEGNDFDTLDLTGQGPFYLENVVEDSNGNGIDGTVVFVDADGVPTGETLTFTEIEAVIGEEVNRGPIAGDDTASVDEDGSVDINVLGNDSDPDGDDLTVTDATSPDGDVVINADGTITFTPDDNFNGDTTITYTVDDGNGGTDTATVTVTVNPVNDDPVANDDTADTMEDEAVIIDVLGNDTDVDGDDLTVTDATSPDGTVEINADGTITFTPAENFNGETTITYTVDDGNGGTDTATVTVTVGAVDELEAVNDTAETDEDTPVTIDVVANDLNVDGGAPTIIDASVPADQGTVEIVGNELVFTPAENFNGDATITYTIEDEDGLTDTATATVTVNPINDAPDAVDDADTTAFNTAVTVDLLTNDSDVDGDDLTVTAASVPASEGTLVDNGDGTVTFTPATGFIGEATISYTIQDEEGLSDSAVHVITVQAGVLDGTVEGTAGDDIIDGGYMGDPEGDMVDNNDAILPGDVGDDDLIYGFEGNDAILAGAGDDEVYGGEGDDSILGQGGNDTLSGDAGNDIITGGRDDDTIFGGSDDDVLDGDSGNDSIAGGTGNDSILGGGGNDVITGGQGNDTIDGENNDDMIGGGAGDDVLSGGSGDDKIEGGSGNDSVFGGAGNDDLWGASGDDYVEGGTGNDTIMTAEGNDTVYGGDGNDIIDTKNDESPLTGQNLPDVGYPGVYPADLDPFDDRDVVFGGAGNDSITTGDDDDTIYGGTGRDVIDAGVDDDLVYGGDDNDTIIGSEGNDEIYGDEGDDTIYGGLVTPGPADALNLPDDLDGDGDSNDPGEDLVTFNNNDTLFGGAGNDTIFGADDDDTLFGGEGNDVLDGGVDDDLLKGEDGDDVVIGGQGDDTLFGGDGNDSLDGGIGDDSVIGGAGDDIVNGGDGDDLVAGNDGNDTLFGGDGDDTITGGTGEDQITGGDGIDDINAGLNSDTIFGGNGGDVVVGGEDPDDSDIDVLDLTGSNVDFITYMDDDPEAGTVTFLDGSTMTFSEIENVIPCFTPGTTIATPKGERLVEELREGDRIITRDNGIQEIRWTGRKEMSGKVLVANPHLKPILVRAGALGNGLPERDMLVSPNHRVLVASEKTQLYFEEREVLAAAKHLVGAEGIHAVDVMGTSYIHFMFDRHEVVLSNGAWTESFQPGDYSLKGIGNAQRTEIFELFPELSSKVGLEGYQSARRALKKHEAKLLVK